jgi:hypothetical protein
MSQIEVRPTILNPAGIKTFNAVINNMIERIWNEDSGSQKNFILTILNKSRKRNLDALPDVYYKSKCFFVPNDKYMGYFGGEATKSLMFDLYTDDSSCIWNNYLVFPVTDCIGNIVGLYGYNPVIKISNRENNESNPVYQYSSGRLFYRANYMYAVDGILSNSYDKGVLFLADGLFDSLSCVENGIDCVSLMGSSFSVQIAAMLSMYDAVYILVDNDKAGLDLFKKLRKFVSKLYAIKQKKFKDADDVLTSCYRDKYVKKLIEIRDRKPAYSIILDL